MVKGVSSHSHSERFTPKIFKMKKAMTTNHLSVVFKKGVQEDYNFMLDDIIVEFKDIIGKPQPFQQGGLTYTYRYLDDYACVGIPTRVYNWLLKEAEQATNHSLDRNSLTKTGGYTWLTAEMSTEPVVECHAYSEEKDSLVFLRSLKGVMSILRSNIVGVGHFNISVALPENSKRHILKLQLKKFQLIDKTTSSSTVEVFNKIQPSDDVLKQLGFRSQSPSDGQNSSSS